MLQGLGIVRVRETGDRVKERERRGREKERGETESSWCEIDPLPVEIRFSEFGWGWTSVWVAGVRSLSLTGVAVIFCSAVSVVTSEICRT